MNTHSTKRTETETTAPATQYHAAEAPAPSKPLVHWLGGWAVSEQAMLSVVSRALPQAQHRILTPTKENLEMLLQRIQKQCTQQGETGEENPSIDVVAGYSTGAFLLMREVPALADAPSNAISPAKKQSNEIEYDRITLSNLNKYNKTIPSLLLFAPFADFRAESGLGGRIVSTRLKLLLRRLRSAPLAAVADFYQQSGILLPAPEQLPYAAEELIWGIEQLADTAASADSIQFFQSQPHCGRNRIRAWIGAQDALLDAAPITTLFAKNSCHVLQNASHDLQSLLTAALQKGVIL